MTQEQLAQQQFLTFFLGGEEYAVPVLRVKEILQYEIVTRVPNTARWVKGVFNLRGSVVPVVDLACKFSLGDTEIGRTTCVVIVEVELQGEPVVMGIIVDAVSQVMDLHNDSIEPVPSFGTNVHLSHLLGMTAIGKKFALLLDIDRVLSLEESLELPLEAGDGTEQVPEDSHEGQAASA